MQKSLSFFLIALLLCCTASAEAQWVRFDDRLVNALDFLNAKTGLVSFQEPASSIQLFNDAGMTGVFVSPDKVTALIIQDTTRAWAFVQNNGLYAGSKYWTTWSKVSSRTDLALIAATPGKLFLNVGGQFSLTTDGVTFDQARGIRPTDSIVAMDYLNSEVLFAASDSSLYRSKDGGSNWTRVLTNLNAGGPSVFVDRDHGLVYSGGNAAYKSVDSGATWQETPMPPSLRIDEINGRVVGTHDCTGYYYIVSPQHGTILRSETQGSTFQEVGPLPTSQTHPRKLWTFNRGSAIYWWDTNRAVSKSLNGLNGLITNSITQYILLSAAPIYDTICGKTAVNFDLTISSLICAGVRIDSITVLKADGQVNTKYKPDTLRGDTKLIRLKYTRGLGLTDTLILRVWYHGLEYNISESTDAQAVIHGANFPPALDVPAILNFGRVKLDSTKSLTLYIHNKGCAELRIDSLVLTNDAHFSIKSPSLPLLILSDSVAPIKVTYTPATQGKSVESIEVGSNAGHTFITVSGEGTQISESEVGAYTTLPLYLFPNPANTTLHISGSMIGDIDIFDITGRTVLKSYCGANEYVIPVADLPNGLYQIRHAGLTNRFLIQH